MAEVFEGRENESNEIKRKVEGVDKITWSAVSTLIGAWLIYFIVGT